MKLNITGKSISGGFKISKAQKATLEIIGATAVVLGVGLVLVINFNKYISFNQKVIEKQNDAIAGYSESIKKSGACLAPKDKNGIYSEDELKKCTPDNIEPKDVVGSLRFNIMNNVLSDISLESVARTSLPVCINGDTDEPYTSEEIAREISDAKEKGSSEDVRRFVSIRELCTALRVIPDAIPVNKNIEASLASLNEIFLVSDWSPGALAPVENSTDSGIEGLYVVPIGFSMPEDATMNEIDSFFSNLGKSIRYFNITSLRISEKKNSETIGNISVSAGTYYSGEVEFYETTNTIKPGGKK